MPATFDHRLVALLQLTGLLASQMQGLLATALQLITVVLSLSGCSHELGSTSSRRQLLRHLQLLLAALPLAVVLFLFVPGCPRCGQLIWVHGAGLFQGLPSDGSLGNHQPGSK